MRAFGKSASAPRGSMSRGAWSRTSRNSMRCRLKTGCSWRVATARSAWSPRAASRSAAPWGCCPRVRATISHVAWESRSNPTMPARSCARARRRQSMSASSVTRRFSTSRISASARRSAVRSTAPIKARGDGSAIFVACWSRSSSAAVSGHASAAATKYDVAAGWRLPSQTADRLVVAMSSSMRRLSTASSTSSPSAHGRYRIYCSIGCA